MPNANVSTAASLHPDRAFVTLVTNDAYIPGAVVLSSSLKRSFSLLNPTHQINNDTLDAIMEQEYNVMTHQQPRPQIVVMYTQGLSESSIDTLKSSFDQIFCVDPITTPSPQNLSLLGRPDLGLTLTKLHVWTLPFKKVVFLDADTLVLQNIADLFERPELSAAPDVGWPDCFNSGVFVCCPSQDTFDSILHFASQQGSFDGGDQGLLNDFFSDWSKSPDKRLPFVYNVTPSAMYTYIPAYRRFRNDIKIVHFIGSNKPWTFKKFSDGSPIPKENASEDYMYLVGLWWKIYNTVSSHQTQHTRTTQSTHYETHESLESHNSYKSFLPGVGGLTFGSHNNMEEFCNYRVEWPEDAYYSFERDPLRLNTPYEVKYENYERAVKFKQSPTTPTFSPGLPMNFDQSLPSDQHNLQNEKMRRRSVGTQNQPGESRPRFFSDANPSPVSARGSSGYNGGSAASAAVAASRASQSNNIPECHPSIDTPANNISVASTKSNQAKISFSESVHANAAQNTARVGSSTAKPPSSAMTTPPVTMTNPSSSSSSAKIDSPPTSKTKIIDSASNQASPKKGETKTKQSKMSSVKSFFKPGRS